MATISKAPTLPGRDALDKTSRAMNAAYSALERVQWDLIKVHGCAFDVGGRPEDEAEVELGLSVQIDDERLGMLYRFLNDAKIEVEQISGKVAEIERTLNHLDIDGRDLDCKRAERAKEA